MRVHPLPALLLALVVGPLSAGILVDAYTDPTFADDPRAGRGYVLAPGMLLLCGMVAAVSAEALAGRDRLRRTLDGQPRWLAAVVVVAATALVVTTAG